MAHTTEFWVTICFQGLASGAVIWIVKGVGAMLLREMQIAVDLRADKVAVARVTELKCELLQKMDEHEEKDVQRYNDLAALINRKVHHAR